MKYSTFEFSQNIMSGLFLHKNASCISWIKLLLCYLRNINLLKQKTQRVIIIFCPELDLTVIMLSYQLFIRWIYYSPHSSRELCFNSTFLGNEPQTFRVLSENLAIAPLRAIFCLNYLKLDYLTRFLSLNFLRFGFRAFLLTVLLNLRCNYLEVQSLYVIRRGTDIDALEIIVSDGFFICQSLRVHDRKLVIL